MIVTRWPRQLLSMTGIVYDHVINQSTDSIRRFWRMHMQWLPGSLSPPKRAWGLGYLCRQKVWIWGWQGSTKLIGWSAPILLTTTAIASSTLCSCQILVLSHYSIGSHESLLVMFSLVPRPLRFFLMLHAKNFSCMSCFVILCWNHWETYFFSIEMVIIN